MGPRRAFEHFMAEHGQQVTVVKAGGSERFSAKALQNRLEGSDCFQFRPQDNVAVSAGDTIIQDLTADEWLVSDVRSEVMAGKVAWKAAYVTSPSRTTQRHSVVQNLDLKGATIGGLAVGGESAVVWGSQAVATRGAELLRLFQQISSAIARDDSLSEDAKHDLQIDVRNIANELSKRRPWVQVVLKYIGHLADVSSLAVLANRLGALLVQIGLP